MLLILPSAVFLALPMLLCSPQLARSQADCSTAAGQLALMVAKVVVGSPTDVDDTHTSSLGITFTSELFHVPQNETSNTSCDALVSLAIYSASTSAKLSGLPTLATTNENFALPTGVTKKACTKSRSGNTLNCSAVLSRTGLAQGATVFYRVGKRISKANAVDPYVWSTTYSFVVTPPTAVTPPPPPSNHPPTANAGADRVIVLPTNTVQLTGAGSDPEGTVTFSWARQSGPSTPTIVTPTAAATSVTGLVQGSYTFVLTVRDNAGATATDAVVVTVNSAPCPDLTVTILNQFISAGDNFDLSEMGNFALCSTDGSRTPKITTIQNLILRVTNVGQAATTQTCTLRFNKGSNTNVSDQTLAVNILQAGASQDVTVTRIESRVCATRDINNISICIRCGDGIQGVRRWNDSGISATVDNGFVISECNENNNTVAVP